MVAAAAEAPADADLVIGVADGGTPAAIGFSKGSGIPYNEALIKNRYVARTFIQPEQGMREQGNWMKFNLSEVEGKRIVVVDDSIVRGNTTRQLVQMLFDAGADIHVRVVAAGRLAVLLRDRHGRRGSARRGTSLGRGDACPRRR